MGFEYNYTCPLIDEAIGSVKLELEELIDNLVTSVKNGDEIVVDDEVENFYAGIECHFEAVRTSNENIRQAAEEQIEEVEEILNQQ